MNKFTNFISVIVLIALTNVGLSHVVVAKSTAPQCDLLILGGTVVTMDADRSVIEDGAIAVKDNKIVAVGKASDMRKFRAKKVVNAAGKIVIPGLINTHTHVPMTLLRGIGGDLDLNEWLTKFIFPAEAKNVNEAFVRAGTQLGLAEMIRSGTTTFADMYYFEDAIADETYKAGMRGILGETIIDFPVPDAKTPAEGLANAERFITKWQSNSLIIPALAPHAVYTVSRENLLAVRKMSDRLKAPILIHVAETQKEVNELNEASGKTPVEYLNEIGFLNDRVIAAHTIYITDNEIAIMKAKNVGAAHCPQSNMKLASGVAPIVKMLAADVSVGLGTDGAASNNDLDMWEEIDTAAKLHKVFSGDPKAVNALQAFEMATIRGARALDLEDKIGSIEIGKLADIVLVDADTLHQVPTVDVYTKLVYSTKAADVSTVIVNGKVLMLDRKLLTLNEAAIKRDAILIRKKIEESLRN